MTVDFDLFILVDHFRIKQYELLCVDLDAPRGFIDFNDQTFDFVSVMKY